MERLYSHIRQFTASRGSDVQIIIVDNSPPDSQRDILVVEFTRDPANPPYGLIEDALPAFGDDDGGD